MTSARFVPVIVHTYMAQTDESTVNDARWSLHEAPIDSADHDEELYVRGQTVIWSAGDAARRIVRKVYRVDSPVLQTLWCCLPEPPAFSDEVTSSESETRTLCVVEETVLTLFAASGAIFSVPLPFKTERVFAMDEGLLILREENGSNLQAARRLSVGMEDNPRLFSLLHPLDELKPVSWASDQAGDVNYVQHSVLFAERCLALPLIVTYYHESTHIAVIETATHPPADHLAPEIVLRPIWKGSGMPPDRIFGCLHATGSTLIGMLYKSRSVLECVVVDEQLKYTP